MFSIAVCTYNRAEQLSVLMKQFLQMQSWLYKYVELIVVDNNSSDSTLKMLDDYKENLPLKVFTEKEQGLAAARNRAINEYQGDALLFFDDDVTVSQTTLEAYKDVLNTKTEMGFFGGKIEVDWQGDFPKWLKSKNLVLLNGLFGQYDLGNGCLEYQDITLLPFGANFMLRRELINKVGFFDTSLGVKGPEIGRGEETDYFKRAKQLGFQGVYCPNAKVGHRFQKDRINIAYLYRYGIEKGRAVVLVDRSVAPPSRHVTLFFQKLIFLVKGLFQLCKGRRDRFYQCVINIGIKQGVWQASKSARKKVY